MSEERTHIPRRAKQCENTAGEGEENEKVEEGELENINHHSAKGHLIMLNLTQGLDEIDRLS